MYATMANGRATKAITTTGVVRIRLQITICILRWLYAFPTVLRRYYDYKTLTFLLTTVAADSRVFPAGVSLIRGWLDQSR